jgi:hypothetical protein
MEYASLLQLHFPISGVVVVDAEKVHPNDSYEADLPGSIPPHPPVGSLQCPEMGQVTEDGDIPARRDFETRFSCTAL